MRHISPQTLSCAVGTGVLAAGVAALSPLFEGTFSASHGVATVIVACIATMGVLLCRLRGQAADARMLHDAALKGADTPRTPDALGEAAAAISALRDEALRSAAAGQAMLEALDATDGAAPYLLLDAMGTVSCASPALLALLDTGATPAALPATPEWLGLRAAPADANGAELLRQIREGRAVKGEIALSLACGTAPSKDADKGAPPCLIHLALSARPITDAAGRAHGSFVLLRDMTALRAAQCTLASTSSRIERFAATSMSAADEVSRAAEDLAALIQEANAGANSQQERTAETATAMEQMNATVVEVARNAAHAADQAAETRRRSMDGARQVNELVDHIGGVERVIGQLAERVGALDAQAGDIGQVMNVISDIADQTNLLALNAAIEAARAGDAGRGFAVVADEVRKLAEKTMGATKQVGDSIRAIQAEARQNMLAVDGAVQDMERVVELTGASGRVLDEIVRGVETSADQIRSIATAAEQQSATSDEINRSIDEINRITADTANGVARAAEAVHELSGQMAQIAGIINELKGGK